MVRDGVRSRLKDITRNIAQPKYTGELTQKHINNYQEKLLPLFQDNYGNINTDLDNSPIPLALEHTLDVPIVRIAGLTVHPGEPHFILWFTISAYFPLISACLGPLANMISIIALIQHWRYDNLLEREVPDLPAVVVLNTLSLVLGILGNISLLMNFSGTLRYLITQTISILCWFIACIVLVAGIIITNHEIDEPNSVYSRSEGFWMAVFTAYYYLCCSLVLLVNFLGFYLKKYPPAFNLNQKQRTLMVYTITFGTWCIIGTVIMEHMIGDLSYGSALYYCIVSFLTIGLGDILPRTTGSRVVILVLSIGGVLNMGLLVAMIRQVVLSSSGPTIFWHRIEKERVKEINRLEESNTQLDSESSFHAMRVIRKRAGVQQVNISLLFTIIIFCLYWLIGAAVFHAVEGWTYFEATYFCFLCLLTIGYGDFSPKTAFGRVFFISWAITAIPLMTILISNIGDKLFDFADIFSDFFSKTFLRKHYDSVNKKKHEIEHDQHLDSVEDAVGDQEAEEDMELDQDMGTDNQSKDIEEQEARETSTQELTFSKSFKNDMHNKDIQPGKSVGDSVDSFPQSNPQSSQQTGAKFNPQSSQQTDAKFNPQSNQFDSQERQDPLQPQDSPKQSDVLMNIINVSKSKSAIDDEQWETIKNNTEKRLASHKDTYESMLNQMDNIKPLIFDSVKSPDKKYDHEEWCTMLDYTEDETTEIEKIKMYSEKFNETEGLESKKKQLDNYTPASHQNLFWLSDKSPLRLPLKEPNYLVMKTFFKIEADLKNLIMMEMEDSKRLKAYYDQITKIRNADDMADDRIEDSRNSQNYVEQEKLLDSQQPSNPDESDISESSETTKTRTR